MFWDYSTFWTCSRIFFELGFGVDDVLCKGGIVCLGANGIKLAVGALGRGSRVGALQVRRW